MLDSKVYNNVHKAKDASIHTVELEMLKAGKKTDALVSIRVSQVVLMQLRQKR